MISMIEAGNVRLRRGAGEGRGCTGMGGEPTQGGGGFLLVAQTVEPLPMKNEWNISQEHNYLHGSED